MDAPFTNLSRAHYFPAAHAGRLRVRQVVGPTPELGFILERISIPSATLVGSPLVPSSGTKLELPGLVHQLRVACVPAFPTHGAGGQPPVGTADYSCYYPRHTHPCVLRDS